MVRFGFNVKFVWWNPFVVVWNMTRLNLACIYVGYLEGKYVVSNFNVVHRQTKHICQQAGVNVCLYINVLVSVAIIGFKAACSLQAKLRSNMHPTSQETFFIWTFEISNYQMQCSWKPKLNVLPCDSWLLLFLNIYLLSSASSLLSALVERPTHQHPLLFNVISWISLAGISVNSFPIGCLTQRHRTTVLCLIMWLLLMSHNDTTAVSIRRQSIMIQNWIWSSNLFMMFLVLYIAVFSGQGSVLLQLWKFWQFTFQGRMIRMHCK